MAHTQPATHIPTWPKSCLSHGTHVHARPPLSFPTLCCSGASGWTTLLPSNKIFHPLAHKRHPLSSPSLGRCMHAPSCPAPHFAAHPLCMPWQANCQPTCPDRQPLSCLSCAPCLPTALTIKCSTGIQTHACQVLTNL